MQMREAKRGKLTPEIEDVARSEGLSAEFVRRGVAAGRIVILANQNRRQRPVGVGEGLRVKINANIGSSPDYADPDEEVRKAKVAVQYGADSIMDLSVGGDIDRIRRMVIEAVDVPLGTVPIYQAAVDAVTKRGHVVDMSSDDIFNAIRKHAEDGVDFVTVHCGVTRGVVETLQRTGRLLEMVSRGGSILAAWMLHNGEENPLYSEFDYLLELARDFDLTLSLGDGMRPGCLADASDAAQFHELLVLGELVKRARKADVQSMVEGPGHLPLDQIEANVKLEKAVCDGAPFYVLGPLVTDVAPGYDHIAAAIGGALAAWAGADFLCYVTPAEHLGLPTVEDVRVGVIAARIAAHVADIARGRGAEWDRQISDARRRFDWSEQIRLAVDPELAREIRGRRPPVMDPATCSMCSQYCALKLAEDYLRGTSRRTTKSGSSSKTRGSE
jgi:phosphomethylpyrimidine synthase